MSTKLKLEWDVQPVPEGMFYFLLYRPDYSYLEEVERRKDPGCVTIGCPFVAWETEHGDYGSILSHYPVCTGFESEKACWACEERYMDGGAAECRAYQIEMEKRQSDQAKGVSEEATS